MAHAPGDREEVSPQAPIFANQFMLQCGREKSPGQTVLVRIGQRNCGDIFAGGCITEDNYSPAPEPALVVHGRGLSDECLVIGGKDQKFQAGRFGAFAGVLDRVNSCELSSRKGNAKRSGNSWRGLPIELEEQA